MLLFWIAAALLSAAAGALVLWRAQGAASRDVAAETAEAEVYRRHLIEQDELKARGLLDEAGWRAARAEAGRRLLAVPGAHAPTPSADPKRLRAAVLGAVVASSAVALAVYAAVGSPGAVDRPFSARLAEWRAADPSTLGPAEASAVLASIARERPQDGEVWSFLGRARAAAGDSFGAAQALERAVRLRPNSAEDWSALGEVLIELNGGKVGPDADRALRRALELDSRAPGPRYALGRAAIAEGRREEGLRLWREALSVLAPDDPRRAALAAEITAAERAPAAQPAPDEAAIRAMVEGLAARLETQPDDPQGWARLVRSYTVLNDMAARDRALARARTLFRDRPADLAAVEAAAR